MELFVLIGLSIGVPAIIALLFGKDKNKKKADDYKCSCFKLNKKVNSLRKRVNTLESEKKENSK